jgi:hypothetical protein
MTYGIKLKGLNNSLPISSFSPTMIFRGKAILNGSGFYPSDVNGIITTLVTVNPRTGGNPPISHSITYASSNQPGYYEARHNYTGGSWAGATCISSGNILLASGTIKKDIVIFDFRIECPTEPLVFLSSSIASTKASVLGLTNVGSNGVNIIWNIKLNVSFVLGTPESTILSQIGVYCFSEVHPSDFSSNFGIRTYDNNGDICFTSEKKILKIKDYVEVTASSNPPNLADIIFSRNFAPNPEISMFSLNKPGFMNIDFARYGSREYVTKSLSGITGGGCNYRWPLRVYINYDLITSGVNKNNSNSDLDYSLSVIKGLFEIELLSSNPVRFDQFSIPDGVNSISYKNEIFPTIIPVIDCTEYD